MFKPAHPPPERSLEIRVKVFETEGGEYTETKGTTSRKTDLILKHMLPEVMEEVHSGRDTD